MARRRGNGEGTITRRKDGRWEGRYTLHTGAGPKRKVLYGRTQAEVAAKLTKAMSDRDGGLIIVASNITVGDYLDRWLEDCIRPLVRQGKLEHSTYIRYAGIIRNHIKPHLGYRKLQSLNRMDVRRLYNETGKDLSARSVDYIHVTLQKSLAQAMRDDLVPRNVASGERACSRHSRSEEAKALSPTQVHRLLGSARGLRKEALYVVAVHTGLRQGELLGLKWNDLDLDAGKLSVRRTLTAGSVYSPGGPVFDNPKRSKSRRSIKLTAGAVEALKRHKAAQNAERLKLGTLWEDDNLVFPNRVGKPMDHNNLYHRDFKAALERAGLPMTFRFHDLRHTCATLLLSKNVNAKIVQEILGHANISQTMDIYSHVLPNMQDEAATAMESALLR